MTDSKANPILIGGDLELANFIVGADAGEQQTDREASRRLLEEIEGLPRRREYGSFGWAAPGAYGYSGNYGSSVAALPYYGGYDAQDWGRKWLSSNGSCIYIDLNHLELATPEVLSANDFVAVWAAMLRIAHRAQLTANVSLPEGERIVVLANNSDRQGNSYGGHINFLLKRETWELLLRHRSDPALFNLMAYQVSSIVFTGQGKVGSENGHAPVDYQISQRADFMETLVGEQTTHHRPIVNSRNEPLCGRRSFGPGSLPGDTMARLHVIFYDTSLAPVTTFLKTGVMQIVLAMIQSGWSDERLILRNPLAALHGWSCSPDLEEQATLLAGTNVTAVELQLLFLEKAKHFYQSGGCDGVVTEADRILSLWEDTLLKLTARDFDALAPRLDWVLKRHLLEQALGQNPEWSWSSAEIRQLDQIY